MQVNAAFCSICKSNGLVVRNDFPTTFYFFHALACGFLAWFFGSQVSRESRDIALMFVLAAFVFGCSTVGFISLWAWDFLFCWRQARSWRCVRCGSRVT